MYSTLSKYLLVSALALLTACAGQRSHAIDVADMAPAARESEFIMDDGYRLPFRRWGPEDPRIVLLVLHGFNDHSGSMENLALHLAANEIAVYAYDQRGFGATATRGRWAGHQRLAADAALVATLLRERYPDMPFYLAGKSMGGAVAILALVEASPPVDGAILIAPAVWGRGTMPWYQRTALWLGKRVFPGVSFSGRFLQRFIVIRPTDDPAVMAQLRNDPWVLKDARADTLDGLTGLMDAALDAIRALPGPALILYGGQDDIIPMPAACAMLQRLTIDGTLRRMGYYPEGYHMLTRQLDAGTVLDDIAAWLHDPVAPLPSGREVDHAHAVTAICDGVTIGRLAGGTS